MFISQTSPGGQTLASRPSAPKATGPGGVGGGTPLANTGPTTAGNAGAGTATLATRPGGPIRPGITGIAKLTSPPGPAITNPHNGPVIKNPKVTTLYLGDWSTPSQVDLTANLEDAMETIMNSDYLPSLNKDYGIGRGVYNVGSSRPHDFGPAKTIKDSELQKIAADMAQSGAIAAQDGLLVIYVPPGVSVVEDWATPSPTLGPGEGYHSWATPPYVVINTSGTFDQTTSVLSHELAEAVTDPQGKSWKDYSRGDQSAAEIGDFTEGVDPDGNPNKYYGATYPNVNPNSTVPNIHVQLVIDRTGNVIYPPNAQNATSP